ncbi:pilus assembly protein PilP [Aggregatibacter actinomycetemcomitans]|uniref:pilus assembly protein PilP n=1 Tax=Aggregatibacter actinomycetemcomitans TaxID=714 RepID=UPI00197C393B|nr:pilus assembly protein PilP [Aggregatibacter actinomycetemcomitans]MBN6076637.1 pilus assembly protein PilP [Aggregatibacter actinomycetemcomitans]
MLHPLFVFFIGVLFSLSVAANDPFDKTQRGVASQKTSITETTISAPCYKATDAIFSSTPFDQISVVGVLQQQKDWQLLLLADNQMSLAKQGDFIAAESLKIEHIGKQEIRFLRWNNPQNCELITTLNIKF